MFEYCRTVVVGQLVEQLTCNPKSKGLNLVTTSTD
jgi:hypothetical protein